MHRGLFRSTQGADSMLMRVFLSSTFFHSCRLLLQLLRAWQQKNFKEIPASKKNISK
jgi:hypothetical protein